MCIFFYECGSGNDFLTSCMPGKNLVLGFWPKKLQDQLDCRILLAIISHKQYKV